jgi:hypothetical protein
MGAIRYFWRFDSGCYASAREALMYQIENGYIVFDDGTCVKSISGGQDEVAVDFSPDFVLNVNSDMPSGVPTADLPGAIGGGVPFGDTTSPGNLSLADIIRTGGDPTFADAGSLSDAVRSGSGAPFDPSTFNPNVPAAEQAGSIGVMDVVKTVTGLGAGIASIFLGRGGSSNPSANRSATNGTPSLAQRLFGVSPGTSGNVPSSSLMGMVVVVIAAIGLMLVFRSRSA